MEPKSTVESVLGPLELVYCRDCIYYKKDPDPIDPGWPMYCEDCRRDMLPPYGFCAWGEKKKAGDKNGKD